MGVIGVWFTNARSLGGMMKQIEDKEEINDMVNGRKSAKPPDLVRPWYL